MKNTLLLLLCLFVTSLFAEEVHLKKAQACLNNLEKKIAYPHEMIVKNKNKKEALEQELVKTENKIQQQLKIILNTQEEIIEKNKKIDSISLELKKIEEKKTKEQNHLAKFLQLKHKMGPLIPINVYLNQDQYRMEVLISTYYKYILKSSEKVLQSLHDIEQEELQVQFKLTTEENNLKALINKLQYNLDKLALEKNYQEKIIQKVGNNIEISENELAQSQKDKKNLNLLIQNLIKESTNQHSLFDKHKLPYPVMVMKKEITLLNQGLLFKTEKSLKVSAVYQGKVVFSDWLKGYGYLIIIDHGKGYMTLYANNETLLKQRGELVLQGEPIAKIGNNGALKEKGLYFEIRHRGKAISPLEWMS